MPNAYYILDEDGNVADTAQRDVSEMITNLTPSETPIVSALATLQARAAKVETMQDTDPEGDPMNAHGFTESHPPAEGSKPTFLENWTQRFMRTARVSRMEEEVQIYGVGRALRREESKQLRILKKDGEARVVSDGTMGAPATTSDGKSYMAGLGAIITTHQDGTTATIDIAAIDDIMLSITDDGGDPQDLYCSGQAKKSLANLRDGDALVPTRQNREVENFRKGVQVLDLTFGSPLNIHQHHMMPMDVNGAAPDILILQLGMLRMRPAYGPRRTSLQDNGEGPGTFLDWVVTIDARAEVAHGQFNNLS